jgi:hypothetical protein
MATNLEVRLLLELWNPDDIPMGHGILNKRLTGKNPDTGENLTALEKNTTREKLMAEGSIVPGTKGKLKGFVLTDSGKTALADALVRSKFTFKTTIISTRTANALLEWFRSNPVPSAEPVAKAVGSTIESYEAFKVVALGTFDRLNRDFNMDNLVPIYRIRREIGDRVERSEFSDWLLKMQSDDVLQLSEGSVEDSAPEKIQDSVTTKLGKLRCYAQRISA